MKKILLVAAVAGLTMVSCKKDRTCTCTNSSSAGGTATVSTTTLVKVSKAQGKANCIKTTSTNNGVTYTNDCKLS
ncbi:MAG: hypothetical protein JWO32_1266 [Bacteroidetes bacterium]|nr:hypothetical protein [Bacteroidota bacterium]